MPHKLKTISMSLMRTIKFAIRFFFVLADKHPTHKSYEALCSSLSRIADPDFDKSVLQNWLSKFIFPSEVGSIKFL